MVVAVISAMSLLGCEELGSVGLTVTNETDETIYIRVVAAGTVHMLGGPVEPGATTLVYTAQVPIQPHNLIIGQDRCLLGDLIAVTPDDREIARQSPPVCLNFTWIVREGVPAPSR